MISRYAEELYSDEDQLASAIGGEVRDAKQLSDYLKHVEKETSRVITVFGTYRLGRPVSDVTVYRGDPLDRSSFPASSSLVAAYKKKHNKPLTDNAWTITCVLHGDIRTKIFKNRKRAARFLYSHLMV